MPRHAETTLKIRAKNVKLAAEISKLRRWREWKIIPVVQQGLIVKEDKLKRILGISAESARKLCNEIQRFVNNNRLYLNT